MEAWRLHSLIDISNEKVNERYALLFVYRGTACAGSVWRNVVALPS